MTWNLLIGDHYSRLTSIKSRWLSLWQLSMSHIWFDESICNEHTKFLPHFLFFIYLIFYKFDNQVLLWDEQACLVVHISYCRPPVKTRVRLAKLWTRCASKTGHRWRFLWFFVFISLLLILILMQGKKEAFGTFYNIKARAVNYQILVNKMGMKNTLIMITGWTFSSSESKPVWLSRLHYM